LLKRKLALVGYRVAAAGDRGAGIGVDRDRLVGAGAVDVAASDRARAVIFGDQGVAVVEELGDPRRASAGLEQPPERVVEEAGAVARAGRGSRAVDRA
jgi:hypothetical protein